MSREATNIYHTTVIYRTSPNGVLDFVHKSTWLAHLEELGEAPSSLVFITEVPDAKTASAMIELANNQNKLDNKHD